MRRLEKVGKKRWNTRLTLSTTAHPYGDINIKEKKREILESLERMNKILQEYKTWTKREDTTKVKQLLQKTREIQAQKVAYYRLQESLNRCRVIGTRHLEFNYPGNRHITTRSRLQMIASDGPGLTFFEDEYDPSTPVSIVCGNSVYIEVTLVDDCAEQLEFLVEEEKEEFLSRILLEKLK
eukprot:TRINITY_DN5194_c0_g3_i22.p2 TRINITY_DN5194_c0_g3~~TRINITY_DN5194_c0_g3_i22.p2  ORF type:complete len:181 (+),score=44.60 TRINITY_DN5194_c0_g3_i22:443-985(+)